ncbi:MAG: flagellar biosynthetic protein FliO [Tumebacillaceae bacterium]
MSSPPHVLAVGGSVDDAIKSKQSGQTPATPPTGTGDGSAIWSVIQLIFALAIIIAIIYLLIRFLSTRTSLSRGHVFRSLGAHSLATNRSVHAVAVGDKVYLLGVGENVTLLDTVDDPEVIEQLRGPDTDGPMAPVNGLQNLLGRFRSRAQAPQAEEVPIDELNELSFDATLREKLNNLKEKRQQAVDDWQEGQK